jgi:predicted amidohydrolase
MDICLAAAQSPSVAGDIDANVGMHLTFIDAARQAGADLLLFPELSLCGYELPLLRDCLLAPGDARLAPIRAAAHAANMTVIVGAPVIGDDAEGGKPCIAAIGYGPDGAAWVYRKQYLHPGEDRYAQAAATGAQCRTLHGRRYAQAICADATHYRHAATAAADGAALYLAGVLISRAGYETDAGKMRQYAADFNMGVLMANHAAPSGGYDAAGRSAFWAPGGELIVQAEGPGNALVVVRNEHGWRGQQLGVTLACAPSASRPPAAQ